MSLVRSTKSLCLQNDTTALYLPFRIESGFTDVSDIGLNTKGKFSVKKAVTCAPLKLEPFCLSGCNDNTSDTLNFSFGVDGDDEYQFQYDINSTNVPGYRLTPFPQGDTMDPRLASQDGFTTVLLLSSPGIWYPEAVDDPLFGSHKIINSRIGRFYEADDPITAMGCVDQWLVCNNQTNICSSWRGNAGSTDFGQTFNSKDPEESKIEVILYWAFGLLDTYHTVLGRLATALNAQRGLSLDNTQSSFPPNQSQVEVDAWFGVSLAKLQLAILSIGIGDPEFNSTGLGNALDNSNISATDLARLI